MLGRRPIIRLEPHSTTSAEGNLAETVRRYLAAAENGNFRNTRIQFIHLRSALDWYDREMDARRAR